MDVDLVWADVECQALRIAERHEDCRHDAVIGIPRGGLTPAAMVATHLSIPIVTEPEDEDDSILYIDDLVDSGATYIRLAEQIDWGTGACFDALYRKPGAPIVAAPHAGEEDGWLVFPWERAQAEAPAEDAVRRLLQAIGEDPDRDGLRDTPRRVVKAWREMTAGRDEDPAQFLATQFDDGYSGMVLVRDIDFTSLCEHHVIPFVGRAHIAYVPSGGRVVGLSKLARVVDVFARRLQIQERMTEQVADAIVTALAPEAVGVVIEARHECLACRGARKANASMITSALRGRMMDEPEMRAEFLALATGRA